MKRTAWTILAGAMTVVLAGAVGKGEGDPNRADDGNRRACSEATLRGSWGIQIHGTRPAPPPPNGPGGTESGIGVVIRKYDGRGSFTQVGHVKWSVTGLISDQPNVGTYEVSENCTGSAHFQPGPGINVVERFVIVDDGNEMRTAATEPAALMVTGVHRRIFNR